MTFFLIVPSVMVVSTFLIYTVCNRLGLRLHYLTLIMCVFFAMAADFGTLAFTDSPSKIFFVKLGGVIFFAAAAVTATNHFLIKRQLEEEAAFSEQVKIAYTQKTEPSDEEKISEVEVKKISAPVEEVAEIKSEPAVEVAEKIIEPVKIPEQKPVEEKAKTVPAEKSEVEKPAEKVEVEPPKKIEQPEKFSEVEVKPPPKVELPKPAEKLENLPPVKIEVQGETLDDILDFAYAEKQQGHLWQAIAAYKKALEKYKNDEYAPFVAIDLGNIYKEQAFYTKAIKTYEDALELPAVRRSASTKAEFQKNLIYLKTVQSVLLRHKALSTPFSKISRAYLQEIETEFQALQMRS